jgi:tetratricopeptide (TPR) repeat protein
VNPNEGTIPFTRGLVHSALGNEQAALPHFVKAIELSPKSATYPFHLGTIFFQYKKQSEALRMFEMALARDPSLTSAASKHAFNNALYIQLALCLWEGFEDKMVKLRELISDEIKLYNSSTSVAADPFSSRRDPFFVHPHMTLSYDVPLPLKLDIARVNAEEELREVREVSGAQIIHDHDWWRRQKHDHAYWHSAKPVKTAQKHRLNLDID